MSKANEPKIRKTSVGGQALIEGIMMNGPKGAALSVRKADGTIYTEMKDFKKAGDKYKILRLPLIRGVVNFVESMILGYKCLMESAELSGQLEAEENTENMSKLDKWLNDKMGPKMMNIISIISMVLGLALAILLFMYLPAKGVDLFDKYVSAGRLENHNLHPLFEGLIRIIIFVLYMFVVSLNKDIKRVFMYHGAEHKTIFCYEHGLELTVENVRKMKRFHPRCGTSFIFLVLIISIIVSSVLSSVLHALNATVILDNSILWVLIKLLVLPLVVGIGYEFIKLAGRKDNIFTKIISAPGLWMQRISTKEPTDDMIEVGIASVKAVITDNPDDDTLK